MALAPIAPPSFEHHVLDFLAYLEFERGLSRNTLEAYRSDLLQFGAYLERAGADVLSAGHAELAGFLDELAAGDGDSARRSRRRRCSARPPACARSTATCAARR